MLNELSPTSSLLASILLGLAATFAFAEAPAAAAPEQTGNGWDARYFDYKPAGPLVVEETTPTRDQSDWRQRPAKLGPNLAAPIASKERAKPYAVDGMEIVRLRFRDLEGADVPVLLVTPANRPRPAGGWPVVIALHGLGSHKAQVVGQVGPTLIRQGFAILAPDLPLHGERPGDPRAMRDQKDLRGMVARGKQAVQDVRLCIDLAEQRPELNTKPGVTLVGYSMGAIINSVAGPADPRVRAMCLMVGGTVDLPPVVAMVPQMAAVSPQLALAHFTGRPLLMLNATRDTIITREMGERLYAAAPDGETKKQVWYDSGHMLPAKAYEEAAAWVAETWKGLAEAR